MFFWKTVYPLTLTIWSLWVFQLTVKGMIRVEPQVKYLEQISNDLLRISTVSMPNTYPPQKSQRLRN